MQIYLLKKCSFCLNMRNRWCCLVAKVEEHAGVRDWVKVAADKPTRANGLMDKEGEK